MAVRLKFAFVVLVLAVHCVFIPVGRDELIPALLEGRGDIAAGNIYITAERRKQVDFSEPVLSGISQIAVTGPGAPPLSGLDSLSGKTVFVRKGSSMHLNLERLNATFKKAGKAPVRFSFAPEHLEDEDLLEMTNAGPGRISQLRREAAQRGLNPNVWFNNVEVIALEKTGRETVQYISNIAKYYLAYKLVTEEQEARQKAKEGLKKS